MGTPKSAEPPVKGPIKPIFSVLPAMRVGAADAGAVGAGDAVGTGNADDADDADDGDDGDDEDGTAATGTGLCAVATTTQQAVTATKASWRHGAPTVSRRNKASRANCGRAKVLQKVRVVQIMLKIAS